MNTWSLTGLARAPNCDKARWDVGCPYHSWRRCRGSCEHLARLQEIALHTAYTSCTGTQPSGLRARVSSGSYVSIFHFLKHENESHDAVATPSVNTICRTLNRSMKAYLTGKRYVTVYVAE